MNLAGEFRKKSQVSEKIKAISLLFRKIDFSFTPSAQPAIRDSSEV